MIVPIIMPVSTFQHTARLTGYCERITDKFDAVSASIQQKQAYASCVNFLYPASSSDFWPKLAVGLLILSFIVGGVYGYLESKKPKTTFHDAPLESSVLGAMMAVMAVMITEIVIGAIYWIFS